MEPKELQFYVDLFSVSYSDVADVSAIPRRELQRDIAEMRHRVAHEGLSFLTRTLPSLAKAVDTALARGSLLQCPGFRKKAGHAAPLFLGWLLRRIFDPLGRERSDASPDALGMIRQLCYLFYKLETPIDEAQANKVIDSFKKTEEELFRKEDVPSSGLKAGIIRNAKNLIHRVLGPVDPKGTDFVPRHGPGAVATGEKSWEKPFFKRFYRDLAKEFPYEEYFYFNLSHVCDELQHFKTLVELESGTAKVVLVPKDSRGPRLISCEPLEYQWIQQGIMKVMVKAITSCPLTEGFVNFDDQSVNRAFALAASCGAPWVTLDMKEASDRVSLDLVELLFPETWVRALKACRTTATKLPDGVILPLKKFAPMGSAVCFPVEALVFWALSVAIIHAHKCPEVNLFRFAQGFRSQGQQPPSWAGQESGRLTHHRLGGVTYVYGDDLIVRSEDHGYLLQWLPRFGLMLNEGKCCTHGSFRESCGCDAYKGVDVTPLRIRKMWGHRLTGTNYVSWVAYRNAFLDRGYVKTADFLTEAIQWRRKTPYSNVRDMSTVAFYDVRKTAHHENTRLGFRRRFNPSLHRYEWNTWRVRSRRLKTGAAGWAEMQRIASYWRSGQDLRLAPYVSPSDPRAVRLASEVGSLVTACEYTVTRAVTLSRGWEVL